MPTRALHTPLCDMLGIEYPIILAGMGGVSSAELVAAVSNAGGLGVIGAASMTPAEIREQCRKVRDLTDKPWGVDVLLPSNIAPAPPAGDGAAARDPRDMLPREHREWMAAVMTEFDLPQPRPDERGFRMGGGFGGDFSRAQVEAILDMKAPVFASGLGNPAPYVDDFHRIGSKVIALVGNVKNARRVRDAGADLIVAQGHDAGGHTGRIGTMALVPQVVDAVAPVPVAAAGGIGDGRGVAAALALGAIGVWIGTAFLVSKEANWPVKLKQRIIDATEEDTKVTRLYSGKTMRNITNPLIERWEASGLRALPMGLQGMVVDEIVQAAAKSGKEDLLVNPAGQISGMLHEMPAAADVMTRLVDGAYDVLRTLPGYASGHPARPAPPPQGRS